MNEYKQVIKTRNEEIADIKMRLDKKDVEIILLNKQFRLLKKSRAKQNAELETDLGIPSNTQSFNFEKRYTLHIPFYVFVPTLFSIL